MPNRFLSAAAAAALTMTAGVLVIAQGFDPNAGHRTPAPEAAAANANCGACDVFAQMSGGPSPPPDSVAEAFRTGFDLWKRVCTETVAACRAAPAPARPGVCAPGTVSTLGPLGRLSRLSGEVTSLAARCQGLTCPEGDCAAAGTLRRALTTAETRVTRWQVESRLTVPDLDLVETARVGAEADLAQVVTLAKGAADTPPSAAALTTLADLLWRRETEFRAIGERLAGPGGETGGPGPWRLKEISSSLGASANALRTASEVKLSAGARPRQGAARWSALGNAIGGAIVNLHNLGVELRAARAQLATSAAGPSCGSAGEAGGLAAEIAGARAALDRCLVQASCPAAGAEAGVSEPKPSSGGLDQLADELARALNGVRMEDAGAVTLSLDDTTYSEGDAIAVRLKGAQNRCLASGGWLGLFKLDASARLIPEPLTRVALAPGGQSEPVLIGAPLETGGFALALFGAQRPESPLGVKAVSVTAPRRAECGGFSGRWQSDFGDLATSVRGGQLRGTYRRSPEAPPGFLIGSVKGRVFTGTWRSELGAGGTRLILSKDGQSFSGTWSKSLDAVDGHGLWQGKCGAVSP